MRYAITVITLCCCIHTVYADYIVSSGPSFGFSPPNPPYGLGEQVIEITFGYGDPSNTIGDGVWHSEPAMHDLSNDPDLAGFLEYATNGKDDELLVTITDQLGHTKSFPYGTESMLYGTFPAVDLYQYKISAVMLEICGIYYQAQGHPFDVIELRFMFYGVPEPTTLFMCLIAIWCRKY